MNPTYVLDTYALIAFFADEAGADKVAEILTAAENGECSLFHEQGIALFAWASWRKDKESIFILLAPILVHLNVNGGPKSTAREAEFGVRRLDAALSRRGSTRRIPLVRVQLGGIERVSSPRADFLPRQAGATEGGVEPPHSKCRRTLHTIGKLAPSLCWGVLSASWSRFLFDFIDLQVVEPRNIFGRGLAANAEQDDQ